MKTAGFIALAGVVFALGFMLRAADKPAAEEKDTTSLVGQAMPAVKFHAADDKEVKPADFKGDVVLLDFWATWCGPCRESLPHLQKIHEDKALGEQGLKVFAVNLREDKSKAKGYLDDNKLTMPLLLDKDGSASNALLIQGIPTTIVIGRDGKIAKAFVGFGDDSEKQMRDAISEALKAGK